MARGIISPSSLITTGRKLVDGARSVETMRRCGAPGSAKLLTLTVDGKRFNVLVFAEEDSARWIRR